MLNRIFAVLLALICVSSAPALAGRFDMTAYECEQMTPARDGVRCAVKYIDGMGSTLLIRIHTRATAPEDQRKRTMYNVGRTIHNFLASGGTWIMMRTTRKDGQVIERVCSRIRGGDSESCRDWHPAEKGSQLKFLD